MRIEFRARNGEQADVFGLARGTEDIASLVTFLAPGAPDSAASFWLNHDHREITPRAKLVLRGLGEHRRRGAQAPYHKTLRRATTKSCSELLIPPRGARIITTSHGDFE